MAIPSEFPFFTMVRSSSCTQAAFWIFLVRHMVFVGDVQKCHLASHLKGLDPSLEICCQSPALTCINEGG